MQSPVRYYITQGDDQAVVHCVHCVRVPSAETLNEHMIEKTVAASATEPRQNLADRAKVARLVRAATRRAGIHR